MLTKIVTDNRRNESEVTTLANAARISNTINETTIGAFSRHSKVSTEPKAKINNVQRQQSADPWKRDVWHTVNLESETKRCSGSSINLMDCRHIQIKMAQKSAERMRQKQVRLEMAQRQHKLNELDEMMQNLKINLTAKSEKQLQKNLLLKEERIIQIVQQIETNSILAEEELEREIEEHCKKTAEKIDRLKRIEEVRAYYQSIKSMRDLFIMLFEKYVKTCITNQQHLKNLDRYTEERETFLNRYESLMRVVNSGRITSNEVDTLEAICDDVKEMQRSVDEEINASQELERTIADRKEKLRLEEKLKQEQQLEQQQLELNHQQQQQQQQQYQQQIQLKPIDAPDAPKPIAALNDSNGFGSRERLSHYHGIMKFYDEYEESVKPLVDDDATKKFRFECKKCIILLSNSISSVSPSHLQNKYDRFVLILSGNSVEIGGTRVTPSQHPLGIRFVNLLVAKMFVQQADASIDVNPTAAFPIASLIVAIWQKFPDFGNLFLAYLYKKCPFLVPCRLNQIKGQSDQDYLKMIGFVFVDDVCEEKSKFLKRLTGLVRLYSSVLISKTRRGINKPHPQSIDFAWIWLTNVLNSDPIADVSATMLHEFILITGAELWKTFDKQFVKVLNLIRNQYIVELNQIDTGGPTTRLQGLVSKILTERKIDPPKEVLPANFW